MSDIGDWPTSAELEVKIKSLETKLRTAVEVIEELVLENERFFGGSPVLNAFPTLIGRSWLEKHRGEK